MNARALKKAAKEYEALTGMDPVCYKGCDRMTPTPEKHEALKRDVEWYRIHTEEIARKLSHLV